MNQAARVIDALKAQLKAQRKTYRDVAVTLGLTEAGVKKAFSSEALSLARIESVCSLLGMSLLDLLQLCKDGDDGRQLVLTLEQEEALAQDEELFVAYYLLLTGAGVDAIAHDYVFTAAKLQQHIKQLHKLNLVDSSAGQRVVLKSAVNPIWLENGPLIRLYGSRLSDEFVLEADLGGGGYQRFLRGRVDRATLEVLKKKMQQIEHEFSLLTASQALRGSEPRATEKREPPISIAYYHGVKLWKFSVVEKYLRR